jgi:hypothetical protein
MPTQVGINVFRCAGCGKGVDGVPSPAMTMGVRGAKLAKLNVHDARHWPRILPGTAGGGPGRNALTQINRQTGRLMQTHTQNGYSSNFSPRLQGLDN